jgi:hypothetical protein
MGVEGARVDVSDVDGGVELTVTASTDQVEEVRIRARNAAELRGAGSHDGLGHDGQHFGHHRHGLRLSGLPPTDVTVEDVDGGARIRLAAIVPDQIDALRERARENVAAASAAPCNL